jgi:diguanylate cyclase (GGDEF)-like protein/PAS domain S-box-containing protein
MFRGIQIRLLGLAIVTVLPVTALVSGVLWNQWRGDYEHALASGLAEARLLAAQVDDQLGSFQNMLMGVSQAVSTSSEDAERNDEVLRSLKKDLPPYVGNVLVFGLDGRNIGTAADNSGSRNYIGDRDYFDAIVGGATFAIGKLARWRTTGEWVIAMARPVHDRNNRLGGVIVAVIKIAHFQNALKFHQLPSGSVVQVVNGNGVVLARNIDSADWIGRDLRDQPQISQHLAAKVASGETIWPDGVSRITGSASATLAPWMVSVGLPGNVALASVKLNLTWGIAAGLVALAAALLLAWIVGRRLIRPLQELTRDAAMLSSGDLGHRTRVAGSDEVGALASAFNAMAESLQLRHCEIELARRKAAVELADRTRLQALERAAKETLAAIIDTSPVAIVCSDAERRVSLWSRAAERIFGYSASETLGRASRLLPPDGAAQSRELFERAIAGEPIRRIEVQRRHKNGTLIDVEVAASAIHDLDGEVRGVAWAYQDITDRKAAERNLNYLALHDTLTGLPNRAAMRDALGRSLENDMSLSVALFDLDGFKDVNDSAGHSAGDELLVQVADRFSRTVGRHGKVYRLGGDEFVAILPACTDPLVIAERLGVVLEALARPYEIGAQSFRISGSVGVALAPRDGTTVDELIGKADVALYHVKDKGGGASHIFMPALIGGAQRSQNLRSELRRAYEANEFELFYQPQIRLHDHAVVGAEALLRWRHPDQGLVAPGAFIDALSTSAIARSVGRWILNEACNRTAQWRRSGLMSSGVSVNLFDVQCRDMQIVSDIEEALRASGLPADLLELEFTESVALDQADARQVLGRLGHAGIRICLDDFGTGFATLNHLTRLPVDRIKIDRSFVSRITAGGRDTALVRSLIALAHALGIAIIAEGVETPAQAAFLLDHGCRDAQGFLYAKPMSADAFERFLQRQTTIPVARLTAQA